MARAAWLLVLIVGLCACSADRSTATPFAPTATLTQPRPQPSPPVVGVPLATPFPSVAASDTITLTVWAPEDYAPGNSRGGQVLRRQLDEFTRTHPRIAINFVLKSPYGKGGILDFLLKAQSLVPGRLPDLTLIDSREVDVAAQAKLLQPLDRDLASGAFSDLLTPAQAMAQYEGRWLDLPIALNAQHLAYNTQITREPPRTWDQLLANGAPFAFPADGEDGFLLQYLADGGRVASDSPSTALDVNIMTGVLEFYQKARAAKIIPDNVFDIKTTHEVWPVFVAGQAPLAQVEARDYVAERERVPNAGYAPLPTREGQATTLVNGWSYVVLTRDPARHSAAAEFLNWMNQPPRLAEWASAARLIPARRSAFAPALKNADYAEFLLKLIENGIVAPSFAERAPYTSAWRTALQSVLRGQATPKEAAAKAAQLVAGH